ncbi:hypothetical protein [Azospirillum soli]|uniref:hypothetical protein n=1 Tax=Azospirillum soli TaxID=1304799 RepID=UPI001AE9119D|nr:hypothetical protein [Azospirillum soli]MBP2312984.1 hypothetical protein [Azospirillum soli]
MKMVERVNELESELKQVRKVNRSLFSSYETSKAERQAAFLRIAELKDELREKEPARKRQSPLKSAYAAQ